MATLQSRPRRVLLVPEGSLYLAFRLPKLFCRAGWEVDLLCLQGDPLVHSRYLRRSMQEASFEGIFTKLCEILRDRQRPWQAVVIAHEETVRRLVATGDAALLNNWQPGAMHAPVREFLLSKFGLATAGREWQLPIPPSRICQSSSEIEAFGRDAGWPIIVKPPEASGGAGVVQYRSPEALAAVRAPLTQPVLAQKFIVGRHGVTEMLCGSGRVLAWLSSYILKQNHGRFGPSTARSFQAMPALQPTVEQIARQTRFEGFCGFDWIQEEQTGRHYLIEFHPRPASGFRFGRACGVNFPAAIQAWLSGETAGFPTQSQSLRLAVNAHYFSCDLMRCLRERDGRGLCAWQPGSGSVHDIFWDDAPLFAAWLVQRFLRRFRPDARPQSQADGHEIKFDATSQCATDPTRIPDDAAGQNQRLSKRHRAA